MRSRSRPRRAPHILSLDPLEPRSLLAAVSGPELLVGFDPGRHSAEVTRLLRGFKAEILWSRPEGASLVRLPAGANARQIARRLEAAPGVRYAEINRTIRVTATLPNDPSFSTQWGLHSANDRDIDAPEAWRITTGRSSVVVAVLDSGIDVHHPDLKSQLWVNPGEIPGNRRDDDGNGYIDDVNGWNFRGNNRILRDDDGHGTHVAGIIAAATGNGVGIAGVAPGVRIMPLKFIGAGGDGDIADAVSAIYYAVDEGARIINASWSGDVPSNALRDAIRYAARNDVVFVMAAGNESVNIDQVSFYPPRYRTDTTLIVAAAAPNGRLASYSNWGVRTVDLAAPGTHIRSTIPGGSYASYDGTSMAAPHVAGVVALVASRFPTLTAAQLVKRIKATVTPLADLAHKTASGGMVNAYKALTMSVAGANGPAVASPPTRPAGSSNSNELTLEEAHAAILGSREYYNRNDGTERGFLHGLFEDLLGRAPSWQEVDRWLGRLARSDRQSVARNLLRTDEARRTMVARWIKSDLDRAAPVAKIKDWPSVRAWAQQLARGVKPDEVRTRLLGSAEYARRNGRTEALLISALYRDILGRAPQLAERALWLDHLRAGRGRAEIVRSILATPEARLTTLARWFRSELGRKSSVAALKNDPNVNAWADRIVH